MVSNLNSEHVWCIFIVLKYEKSMQYNFCMQFYILNGYKTKLHENNLFMHCIVPICIRDDIPSMHENRHTTFCSYCKIEMWTIFAFNFKMCSHKISWRIFIFCCFSLQVRLNPLVIICATGQTISSIIYAIKVGFFVTSKNLPDGCLPYFLWKMLSCVKIHLKFPPKLNNN